MPLIKDFNPLKIEGLSSYNSGPSSSSGSPNSGSSSSGEKEGGAHKST